MNLERRVAALEANAFELRERGVIDARESAALLEAAMFVPELQARREALPAGVKWNPPTPEGAWQVLCDAIEEGEDAGRRRRERLAVADRALTRFGG